MAADDAGIVEAFSVMRTTGASEDDLNVLVTRQFIKVINNDLVSIILDWKINNQIRKDRYHPSIHQKELLALGITRENDLPGLPPDNHLVNQNADFDNQMVATWLTESSLGKYSIDISSPSAQRTDSKNEEFEAFWDAYPRKANKSTAKKAFAKVTASLDTLLQALEAQKRSDQWRRDGGQYIPYAATWLNQRRWEDEIPAQSEQMAAPVNSWQKEHLDWADQSTWVRGVDGLYRPEGVSG